LVQPTRESNPNAARWRLVFRVAAEAIWNAEILWLHPGYTCESEGRLVGIACGLPHLEPEEPVYEDAILLCSCETAVVKPRSHGIFARPEPGYTGGVMQTDNPGWPSSDERLETT
jgi:hypothetical protein